MTGTRPGTHEPGGSPLRRVLEATVRSGQQVVDTTAAFAESVGRVSSTPGLERLGAAQARLLRRTGEAWASAWRSLLR
ncbi:MAG: hypothetical protein M3P95_02515 [Actinomycetota bacterium]|nr:hypothetical protein [Actinomycetota bacterium]